jgi:hypothetical protein
MTTEPVTTESPTDATTYALAEVATEICGTSMADPQRWLKRRIVAGVIPARKVGRQWRMTRDDIDAALNALANKTTAPELSDWAPPADSISAGSARRRATG